MRNKLLAGAIALALIGCSEKPADDAQVATSDGAPATEAANDAAGGNIPLNAAPGVAFDYSYTFRLADDRIAKVQEEHAAACEALGVQHCRIVDVRYRLDDEKFVEAQTRFKLDPGIARKFGSSAIASVEKAAGVLADASVNGEDVGTEVLASQQRSAGAQAEIARIEDRLKHGGLDKSERAELLSQISALRGQLGEERQNRRTGEDRIAWTDVAFNYASDGGVPGIGNRNPFGTAWATLLGSGGTLLSVLLFVGAAVLPWALIAGAAIFLWRRFRPRKAKPSVPAA